MKFFQNLCVLAVACATTAYALSVSRDTYALALRDEGALNVILGPRAADIVHANALEKRKGGGGRGGSSSSSGSSGSSGSSSGSRSGGSSSGSSSSGRTSSSSNAGGSTKSGSGRAPSFGGGRYYAGGATVPYAAGQRSRLGLVPFLLPLTALAFIPLLAWGWTAGLGGYQYAYTHPYSFHNRSANANNTNAANTTLPVVCYCQQYTTCGCDDNNSTEYFDSLVGNGSYAGLNKNVVDVARVNGTDTLVLNGILPNGTTAAGAASLGTFGSAVVHGWAGWALYIMLVCGAVAVGL